MKLFDKRPLSLILCVMLGGFVVFSYGDPTLKSSLLIFSLLLLVCSYTLHLNFRHKILLLISSLGLIFSILFSYIYFDMWFRAYERFDGEVTVSAVISDVKFSEYNTNTYILETDNINGAPFSQYSLSMNLPAEDSNGLLPGVKITVKGELDGFVYENGSDTSIYNFSNGINARLTKVSDIKIVDNGTEPLRARIAFIRSYITRHAIMLSDNETGSLLCALLFGERDTLSDDVRLDFKRIGISHILALSGMHLTILSFGLNKLLSSLRVGKNARVITVIIFTLLYMAFTGFSVSVVRAGIMLIISSLLFLLWHGHDSVTSLAISVSIICLVTPYAIFDVALWLSAFATLGVIMFGEYYSTLPKTKNRLEKLVRIVLSSLGTTLFAVGATALITSVAFKSFSLVTPITTLVFSILVEIIMYVGSFMLIFGAIVPIKYILSPIVSFTIWLADIISSGKFVYVITASAASAIAIMIFAILVYLFFILDIRKKKPAFIILLISYSLIFVSLSADIYTEATAEDIVYSQGEKYDAIIIKSNNRTALIESSQYSASLGYDSVDFLTSERIAFLDAYYATHYSWGLEDELEVILKSVKIEDIYLPKPKNESEEQILQKLFVSIDSRVDEIILYNAEDKTVIGYFTVSPIFATAYGEGTSTNALQITAPSTSYLYLSSGMLDKEYKEIVGRKIEDADVVIFGSHGKKYKNNVYFAAETAKQAIILSSDNCFLTQSSLEFYKKSGCKVISHPHKISIYINPSNVE